MSDTPVTVGFRVNVETMEFFGYVCSVCLRSFDDDDNAVVRGYQLLCTTCHGKFPDSKPPRKLITAG